MSSDSQSDDRVLDALVHGTTYERVRVERFSHVSGTLARKLAIQGSLVGLLALLLPLYELFPPGATQYLPSPDASAAAPKVLVLGLFGGSIELISAGLLCGVAVYRLRNAPLSERQAHSVLDAETFATCLGVGTGGLAIVLTVAFFALGLGGETTLSWYVGATDGRNPFAGTGMSVSVAHVATGALAGGLSILCARAYLASRLRQLR